MSKKLKRIELHSKEELDSAIDNATEICLDKGLDFFEILHGVDAYMERRKRMDREWVEELWRRQSR